MKASLKAAAGVFARVAASLLVAGCASLPATAASYGLRFELALQPDESRANGTITVTQTSSLLREARFRAPPDRYDDFAGAGKVERDGDYLVWRPPAKGGTLRYSVLIDNQRKSGRYDARVARHWALFRGDDVFPAATTRHAPDARSRTSVSFNLPSDWSVVAPFKERADGKTFDIDNPERRFDRPIGWIVAGRLGVRRDTIAGIEVAVAGPVNQGIERISILALLHWTLPVLTEASPTRPPYLNVVAAADGMWRGGLSAPNSVYVHAERPLLSENATSTLLHEIMHALMPVPAAARHDWIDEGLAEYLTLTTLRDSGTISAQRFDSSIRKFARRGRNVKSLLTRRASGDITARAVAVFHAVDLELQKRTGGDKDIYALARALGQETAPVDLARLRDIASGLMGGQAAQALARKQIPLGAKGP